MLRVLMIRIPFFSELLLSYPPAADLESEPTPHIILVLCSVIRTQLTPSKEAMSEEVVPLAQETIGLLESLTWNIPDALAPR